MKTCLALVALLLLACLRTQAQAWVNPLPVDGTSGRIVYRGQVKTPDQSQKELGARAALYATEQLAHSTANATIEGAQPSLITGPGQRAIAWRGGAPGAAGRTLHYVLSIRPHEGYYEYELNKLVNETPAVQAVPGTAVAPTIGAVEDILRKPTSYDKRHRPTAALRSYCAAVNAAALAVLADVQAALTVY